MGRLFTESLLSTVNDWVDWNKSKAGIPNNAVIGGTDGDGTDLYVIKAQIQQYGIFPGKFNKKRVQAYITYAKKEHEVHNFMVV